MTNKLTTKEIMTILPHAYPFLLVDRITDLEYKKKIKGYKNITVNEPWVTGHFPSNPILPGAYITEICAQIAGLINYDASRDESKITGVLVKIEKMKFVSIVTPGDCLEVEAELLSEFNDIFKVRVYATVSGKTVAQGVLVYAITD